MPRVRECCFCHYVGSERRFVNVGTEDYPNDYLCELCDTETDE